MIYETATEFRNIKFTLTRETHFYLTKKLHADIKESYTNFTHNILKFFSRRKPILSCLLFPPQHCIRNAHTSSRTRCQNRDAIFTYFFQFQLIDLGHNMETIKLSGMDKSFNHCTEFTSSIKFCT